MGKIKREPIPPFDQYQIDNHQKFDTSNLLSIPGVQSPNDRRVLAEIARTLISRKTTYYRVCNALERKFLESQNVN